MTKLINLTTEINFNGYTLILPTIAVGNVPQLTIDFLITNYNFKKGGTLWHPAIVSTVGSDPYQPDTEDICTACELYFNTDLKLILIQFRSTLEPKLTLKFFDDLKASIVNLGIKDIIILSSAFDYELHNITDTKFYCLSNKTNDNEQLSNQGIKLLQPKDHSINGSGYAKRLYDYLKSSFTCVLLLKYTSEGDNRPDAFQMLEKVLYLCNLKESVSNLTVPCSWDFVFGCPAPVSLY